MPRDPDPDLGRWEELDAVLAKIDAEHEALRRDVATHTATLTQLHRRADELRAALRIHDVVIDTDPAHARHLRAVIDRAS